MVAYGKVIFAALKTESRVCRRTIGIILIVNSEREDCYFNYGGLLCFGGYVLRVLLLAPGKHSTCTLGSGMWGSLERLESPIMIKGLRGIKDHCVYFSPGCAGCRLTIEVNIRGPGFF